MAVVSSIGLTGLNPELSPDEALVDIVFVHGLGGHPEGTWTYAGPKRDPISHESQEEGVDVPDHAEAQSDPEEPAKTSLFKRLKSAIPGFSSHSLRSEGKVKEQTQPQSTSTKPDAATERKVSHEDGAKKAAAKNNTFFWPQKLPEMCARARVMTFGYDSNVSNFFGGAANQNTFYDHAADLLGWLVRERTNAQDRPIIFVAHSLGGLVVKQMLFDADRSEAFPDRRKLYSSTKALFFLGTPHRGSEWAGWGEIARGLGGVIFDTNSSSIKHLKVNNESLIQLEKHFDDLVYRRTFWIKSFTEAKGFKPLPFLNSKIVNDIYAKVGDPGREQVFSINANHTAMCRFWGKKDPGYSIVAGELSRSIGQIETDTNQFRDTEEKLQQEALLNSLDFEGRRNREDQLWEIAANPQTVEWVWESSFADWASKADDLFWVCGKPASGKSTLMEYIARTNELRYRLRRSISDEWTVVHHFFFDFGVSRDTRNNFEGFLRSLLYQLMENSRGIEEGMNLERDNLPRTEPKQQWSLRALQERLTVVLAQRSNPICILLDGLDEYQDDKWALAQFLRKMASSRVKLCVASRPDQVFDMVFRDVPTIKMQDWNTPAIDRMVTLTVQSSVAASGFYNDDEVVKLAEGISERAHGVFLWARFAINELRDGWTAGLDLLVLQQRLENVPAELEDIYARIFRNLKPEQRQLAAYMLQLVCYAKRTLTLRELSTATAHDFDGQEPLTKQTDIQQFQRRILATTGGILEVIQTRRTHRDQEFDYVESHESREASLYVNLIHRTVRTYLDSNGWSQIVDDDMLHPHELWLRVCAAIFPLSFKGLPSDKEIPPGLQITRRLRAHLNRPSPSASGVQKSFTEQPGSDQFSDVTDKLSPLLEYAALFMLHHAADVERNIGLASYDILQPGMSDSFVCCHRFYWALRDATCACFQYCPEPLHPLHLAVGHGLDGYVKGFLAKIGDKSLKVSHEWDDWYCLEVQDNMSNPGARTQPPFRISLLEFAIRHASKQFHNGAFQVRIVAILLDHHSCVHDAEMIFALRKSSAEVVQLLLPHWPDGKIVLKQDSLRFDDALQYEISDSGLSNFYQERFNIGPMWCIAMRGWFSKEDNAELIDLFLRRGEDINDQCGPLGTALHGALLRLTFVFPDPTMLTLLVNKGADVNASGPLGTPLEFVWRLANTVRRGKYKYVMPYVSAIQLLIESGAVNNQRDPNGSVPSREQMLSFGTSGMEAYRESQRLYKGEPPDVAGSPN